MTCLKMDSWLLEASDLLMILGLDFTNVYSYGISEDTM